MSATLETPAPVDFEAQNDADFALAVDEYLVRHGGEREAAERTLAKGNVKFHNCLVRIQSRRQGHVPAAPPPPAPARLRTTQMLALLEELGVPASQQMSFVTPARAAEDPEKWIREKVAAVAAGREEVPGTKGKCPEFLSASAGMIVENLGFHHDALEQCLMDAASKCDIDKVPSRHAVIASFSDEAKILFRHLGMDHEEISREWSRCARLLAAKALAGTAEERAASRARLAAAKEKRDGADGELAKLQAQMEKLAAKVAAIHKEHDEAAAEFRQKTGAVESLAQDCRNENFLIPSRRLGWPSEGVREYVRGHVGEEPGVELMVPERILIGARRLED